MKLTKMNPVKFFRSSKKSSSVSRSETDPSSFSSQESLSSDEGLKNGGSATPQSVLPSSSPGISYDEWSEIPTDVYFEMKQAFEMMDRDGDGKIRKEELETLLISLGVEPPTSDELKTMLTEVDTDGDGCISLEEFYAFGSAFAPSTCDSELKNAFDFFDSDHDGKITADELLNVFKIIGDARCTLPDCHNMIKNVAPGGDGHVYFEDFRRMMSQQR